jgi:hypothetical protein
MVVPWPLQAGVLVGQKLHVESIAYALATNFRAAEACCPHFLEQRQASTGSHNLWMFRCEFDR